MNYDHCSPPIDRPKKEPYRFTFASDEQVKFLKDELNKAQGRWIGLIVQTTFRGNPDPKKVAKRRAKNKVARRQRRINRIKSER